jgi:hypothetical protein
MKILLKLNMIAVVILLTSCEKVLMEREPSDDPVTNFEHLWQTANDKYSFFEYKGIEWNEIYSEFRPQIYPEMNDVELFFILGSMLNRLEDGHVNLRARFDVSRYTFTYSAPENFNFRLLKDNYIGWNYRITGSLINTMFEVNGKDIGYIYYGSFSNPMQNTDVDFAVQSLWHTEGIILDLRSNGGGTVSNVYKLGSRFADQKRFVYTSELKNGPGHNDFGEPAEVYMEPGGLYQYTKPVILLTNRGCYSATSLFTLAMKAYPHVIQVGDTTGGGLGSPAGFELPNGWGYRFSVSRTLSPDGENFENGVPPDVVVWMNPQNEANGKDDIMEKAIELILNK